MYTTSINLNPNSIKYVHLNVSPPLVFPGCVSRRSRSGAWKLTDNYKAKVLHDPATNDAIYSNRPLSKKN